MIYLSTNRPHFLLSHSDSFLKTLQPSPINVAKSPNRTFPKRKSCTVENGVQIFLLTANGDVRDTPIRKYKRQKYELID